MQRGAAKKKRLDVLGRTFEPEEPVDPRGIILHANDVVATTSPDELEETLRRLKPTLRQVEWVVLMGDTKVAADAADLLAQITLRGALEGIEAIDTANGLCTLLLNRHDVMADAVAGSLVLLSLSRLIKATPAFGCRFLGVLVANVPRTDGTAHLLINCCRSLWRQGEKSWCTVPVEVVVAAAASPPVLLLLSLSFLHEAEHPGPLPGVQATVAMLMARPDMQEPSTQSTLLGLSLWCTHFE
jgi:hypothetical protein